MSSVDRGTEAPLICLGEALVDLICPDPVADPGEATRFHAHFGGALGNVAVAARRAGAAASLAGGSGVDAWGRFLRRRLVAEGVGLDLYAELPGIETPFAFATLDHDREPSFRIHGEGIERAIATLAGRERELATGAALIIGSNTLAGDRGRAVTLAAREAALASGVPVLFDPNLRPGRWPDLERPRRICRELATEATVLKCNLAEARWLSGAERATAAQAAEALSGLGPRLVVVTAGTAPAVARGAVAAEVAPPPVEMVSPLGAGDVFMGTLAAGLLADDWELSDPGLAIEGASRAAAAACTRLGAFD